MRKKLPQKCPKCAELNICDLIPEPQYEFYSCEECKKHTKLEEKHAPRLCFQCATKGKKCGYCCEAIVKEKAPDHRDIVRRVVLAPAKCDKYFWGREMTLLQRLLVKYPDLKFWYNAPIKQVNSLLSFASSDAIYLDRLYKMFHFNPIVKIDEIKLGEKYGTDYNKENKVRTVKQFLSK